MPHTSVRDRVAISSYHISSQHNIPNLVSRIPYPVSHIQNLESQAQTLNPNTQPPPLPRRPPRLPLPNLLPLLPAPNLAHAIPPHLALLPQRGLFPQLADIRLPGLGFVHEAGRVGEGDAGRVGRAHHAGGEGVDLGFHGVAGAVALGGGLGLRGAGAGWSAMARGLGGVHVEGDGSSGGVGGGVVGGGGGIVVWVLGVGGVVGWGLAMKGRLVDGWI